MWRRHLKRPRVLRCWSSAKISWPRSRDFLTGNWAPSMLVPTSTLFCYEGWTMPPSPGSPNLRSCRSWSSLQTTSKNWSRWLLSIPWRISRKSIFRRTRSLNCPDIARPSSKSTQCMIQDPLVEGDWRTRSLGKGSGGIVRVGWWGWRWGLRGKWWGFWGWWGWGGGRELVEGEEEEMICLFCFDRWIIDAIMLIKLAIEWENRESEGGREGKWGEARGKEIGSGYGQNDGGRREATASTLIVILRKMPCMRYATFFCTPSSNNNLSSMLTWIQPSPPKSMPLPPYFLSNQTKTHYKFSLFSLLHTTPTQNISTSTKHHLRLEFRLCQPFQPQSFSPAYHLLEIQRKAAGMEQPFYWTTPQCNSVSLSSSFSPKLIVLRPPTYFQEFPLYCYSNLIKTPNVRSHHVFRINLK